MEDTGKSYLRRVLNKTLTLERRPLAEISVGSYIEFHYATLELIYSKKQLIKCSHSLSSGYRPMTSTIRELPPSDSLLSDDLLYSSYLSEAFPPAYIKDAFLSSYSNDDFLSSYSNDAFYSCE
jgi:hypothetical protein